MAILDASAWTNHRAIRDGFRSCGQLRNFVIVENFLAPDLLAAAMEFAADAPLERFCVFSRTQDPCRLEKDFCEPEDKYFYLTVHRRMRPPNRLPSDLIERMSSSEVLQFLSDMTGLDLLGHEAPGTLTGWGPGDFLGEHCDEGPPHRPTKLVVSISLTSGWREEYGGATHYRWLGGDQEVVVCPTANTATIFEPGEHSVHWVAPIAASAPPGKRFTWTLDYF